MYIRATLTKFIWGEQEDFLKNGYVWVGFSLGGCDHEYKKCYGWVAEFESVYLPLHIYFAGIAIIYL